MQRRMKNGKRSYGLDRILETGSIGRLLRSLVCVDTVFSPSISCSLDCVCPPGVGSDVCFSLIHRVASKIHAILMQSHAKFNVEKEKEISSLD